MKNLVLAPQVSQYKYGIKYNIVKIYPNGVRVGNVEGHKEPKKRNGTGQTWFPKSWTKKDIQRAGEHVAALKSNKHAKDGQNMCGMWKGVKVIVRKTKGRPATIFPDAKQPTRKKGKK
ncbi:MAG: EndoU domain-containing protein [Tissierellia bacterium]|nr:EndoU domain-containing protein [Tissierellia bacterium]